MSCDWCSRCGALKFDWEKHVCPPAWEVLHEHWHGDEPVTVYADDAEAAGRRYAERTDAQGDYTIVGGSEEEVKIRKAGTPTEEAGPWETYTLSGEAVPEYHARRKT